MHLQRKISDTNVDSVSLFIRLRINRKEMLQASRISDEETDKVMHQAYALGESINETFSGQIEEMFGKNSVDMPNFSVVDFEEANNDADAQLYEFVFIVEGSHELDSGQIRDVHDVIMAIANRATEGTTNIVDFNRIKSVKQIRTSETHIYVAS